MSRERLKRIWTNMRHRCHGKGTKDKIYVHYRNRGISVCDEWRNSFEAFKKWSLEHGYADDLTIDRIDCDGDYCPENCRWVTPSENSKNKYHSGRLRPGFVRIKVNKDIKNIADYYDALSTEEKKTLLRLADLIKTMETSEKQRLLDIGTGMVAMKGHLANGKKEN